MGRQNSGEFYANFYLKFVVSGILITLMLSSIVYLGGCKSTHSRRSYTKNPLEQIQEQFKTNGYSESLHNKTVQHISNAPSREEAKKTLLFALKNYPLTNQLKEKLTAFINDPGFNREEAIDLCKVFNQSPSKFAFLSDTIYKIYTTKTHQFSEYGSKSQEEFLFRTRHASDLMIFLYSNAKTSLDAQKHIINFINIGGSNSVFSQISNDNVSLNRHLEFLQSTINSTYDNQFLWKLGSTVAEIIPHCKTNTNKEKLWSMLSVLSNKIQPPHSYTHQYMIGFLAKAYQLGLYNDKSFSICKKFILTYKADEKYDNNRKTMHSELTYLENAMARSMSMENKKEIQRLIDVYKENFKHYYGSHELIKIAENKLNSAPLFQGGNAINEMIQLNENGYVQELDAVYITGLVWYSPVYQLLGSRGGLDIKNNASHFLSLLWRLNYISAYSRRGIYKNDISSLQNHLRQNFDDKLVPAERGWNFIAFNNYAFNLDTQEIPKRYYKNVPFNDSNKIVPMVLKDDFSQNYRSREIYFRFKQTPFKTFPLKPEELSNVKSTSEAAEYNYCAIPYTIFNEDILLQQTTTENNVKTTTKCRIQAPLQAYVIIPYYYYKR